MYSVVKKVPDVQDIQTVTETHTEEGLSAGFESIIGVSKAIKDTIKTAIKAAATDVIVTLRGESGTGKEVFAKAIHTKSGRKGIFIPVNCAALPESLLETELFGYEAGSFTGADKQGKPGLFEVAKNGTLFLDEIADIPMNMQGKLLRALQEQKVRRIGGTKELDTDVRIITATNRNIEEMVQSGLFREDLYFRINLLPIFVPSLNERQEDIKLLANHFLSNLNIKRHEGAQILCDESYEKLLSHKWKGNVRELKNVIERAAILCDSNIISSEFILFASDISKVMQKQDILGGKTLKLHMENTERGIIKETLKNTTSIRQAALKLGISHVALLNKIKKYNL
ncbi:MAG: hypothetical protein C0602_06745 [Denitrovibrio sp.]|nr:MAG: hypothetical protein C0602_06745 [Denitrovibrio sp.]